MFKLSKRSFEKLEGVDSVLCDIVRYAINITDVDFGVISGVRSQKEQAALFKRGASKCDGIVRKSKHQSGQAVDLMAFIGSKACWEVAVYDDIADAMKEASSAAGYNIRWGGAWHIPSIRNCSMSMQDATNAYVDLRRSQGKRPFFDGPHFEMSN